MNKLLPLFINSALLLSVAINVSANSNTKRYFVTGEKYDEESDCYCDTTLIVSSDAKHWQKDPNADGRNIVKGSKGYVIGGWCKQPKLSVDGQTWQTSPGYPEFCIDYVFYAKDRYFTTGDIGDPGEMTYLNSSVDGINYTNNIFCSRGKCPAYIYNIAYGNNIFIGNTDWGTYYYSYDGTNWKVTTTIHDMRALTFSDNKFISIDNDGNVAKSIDGFTWQNISKIDSGIKNLFWKKEKHQYIAVGSDGKIFISNNANDWEKVESGVRDELNYITWSNDLYLVVGDAGTILTSADGRHWDAQHVFTEYDFLGAA